MAHRGTRPSVPQSVGCVLDASRALTRQMGNISFADWRRAAGSRLSERATPESLQAGQLVIRVPSSTWAQEIQLLSPLLLGRLKEAGYAVNQLRFRVSPSTSSRRSRAVSRVRRSTLPDNLRETLATVADGELRSVISEAAALSLGRHDKTR